jgi:hypothetical protein
MNTPQPLPLAQPLVPLGDSPPIRVRAAACYEKGILDLIFEIDGDIEGIDWPRRSLVVSQLARRDELWRTTCFEAFLTDGSAGYIEVNLSPWKGWNIYRFDRYREGMREVEVLKPPQIEVRERRLEASLNLAALFPATARLHAGLTAVVSVPDGPLSYWALRHADEKPDFHRPESFVLEL